MGKFAYEFAEPQRWDVIVFKFPGEATTNYIKRLVGLPGETIRIQHGDLWLRQQDGSWQIARKPPTSCWRCCSRCSNGEFEFQFPWVLALLGLLPVYALLRGKTGRLSALTFSSADIARAAGAQARAAAGRFLFFLRLLAVALGIVALAGPRMANYHVETENPGIDIMLVLDLSWSMDGD